MKLNHDCVRDCLIWLEDNLKLANGIQPESVINALSSEQRYSKDDIVYSIFKLNEVGYIKDGITVTPTFEGNNIYNFNPIYEMTWEGHEYLDTIRDNKVWKKSKEAVKSLKSVPLSIMGNVATKALTSIINQKTGWNI